MFVYVCNSPEKMQYSFISSLDLCLLLFPTGCFLLINVQSIQNGGRGKCANYASWSCSSSCQHFISLCIHLIQIEWLLNSIQAILLKGPSLYVGKSSYVVTGSDNSNIFLIFFYPVHLLIYSSLSHSQNHLKGGKDFYIFLFLPFHCAILLILLLSLFLWQDLCQTVGRNAYQEFLVGS